MTASTTGLPEVPPTAGTDTSREAATGSSGLLFTIFIVREEPAGVRDDGRFNPYHRRRRLNASEAPTAIRRAPPIEIG